MEKTAPADGEVAAHTADDRGLDPIGMGEDEFEGHHAAHGIAEDGRHGEPFAVHDGQGIGGKAGNRVGVRGVGLLAAPVAAQVGHEDGVVRSEQFDPAGTDPVGPATGGVAVEKEDRRTGAGNLVVDAETAAARRGHGTIMEDWGAVSRVGAGISYAPRTPLLTHPGAPWR